MLPPLYGWNSHEYKDIHALTVADFGKHYY